jgi:hypothetical protein
MLPAADSLCPRPYRRARFMPNVGKKRVAERRQEKVPRLKTFPWGGNCKDGLFSVQYVDGSLDVSLCAVRTIHMNAMA